jgi:NAD dependent epimerase/dehydratase family enzyme
MLLPFTMGVGGRLGDGQQVISWIAPDDLVGAYHHALQNEIWGPLNITAPHPVTNAELTTTLARVLRRPAVLPVPVFALRLALGEMAEALAFSTARVIPERLVASGYEFRFTDLESTLRHVLGRHTSEPIPPHL